MKAQHKTNKYRNTLTAKYAGTNLPIWTRTDGTEVWIDYTDGNLSLIDGSASYSLNTPNWAWLNMYYPDVVMFINPNKFVHVLMS